MKIPAGYTEEQVLEVIEKIVNALAPSFAFGYFDIEDMKQEARYEAIKVMGEGKFDETRRLENFLYTHIRNRLTNLRRNKLKRNDPPCIDCHEGRYCSGTKNYCRAYSEWLKRNSTKANLVRPLDIDNISDEHEKHTRKESHIEEDLEIIELKAIIDEKLPVEYRATYLKMQAGVSVPKAKREQIEKIVKEILKGVLPNVDGEDDEDR